MTGSRASKNSGELLELARELQSYPEATLNDCLSYLGFLHQLHDSHLANYLTGLETNVA